MNDKPLCPACFGDGISPDNPPQGVLMSECKTCGGTGYAAAESTSEAPQTPAKTRYKKLTVKDVETINLLLSKRAAALADMESLDESMRSTGPTNAKGGVRVSLSILSVEMPRATLAHFGLAIRAILIQQEFKCRRLLSNLGVYVEEPDHSTFPYYAGEELELYCNMADMMGKSFFED